MADTWIALGTAPLAQLRYEDVRAQYPDAKCVTCNGGIEIEPNPDAWLAVDRVAQEDRWPEQAAALGPRAHVIPRLTWEATFQHIRNCLDADELLPYPDGPYILPDATSIDYVKYETLRLSGLMAVEYAMMQKPETLFIVGMDGYPKGDPSHFHVKTYRLGIPVLMRKYPGIHIRVIGAPLWTEGMKFSSQSSPADLTVTDR